MISFPRASETSIVSGWEAKNFKTFQIQTAWKKVWHIRAVHFYCLVRKSILKLLIKCAVYVGFELGRTKVVPKVKAPDTPLLRLL